MAKKKAAPKLTPKEAANARSTSHTWHPELFALIAADAKRLKTTPAKVVAGIIAANYSRPDLAAARGRGRPPLEKPAATTTRTAKKGKA